MSSGGRRVDDALFIHLFCECRRWMGKAPSTLRLTDSYATTTTRAVRTASRIARPVLRGVMKRLLRDCSLSAVVAGFIATVISYAGPLVIIFQAAKAGGLPHELMSSWVWTISIGSGVLGILLSLRYRVPIVIAWSAPGSALLVTMLPD